MQSNWIIKAPAVRNCLFQAMKYPVLSVRTLLVSLICVISFIFCWLTLCTVSNEDLDAALCSLVTAHFLFVLTCFGWSVKMHDFHRPAAITMAFIFIAIVSFWNMQGEGIAVAIQYASGDEYHQRAISASSFMALNGLISGYLIVMLWPGFYWISLCLLLVEKFRSCPRLAKGMMERMVFNLWVWFFQIIAFGAAGLLLMFSLPLTRMALVVTPLLVMTNFVYVFLVIVRIENGTLPEAVIGQIARIKLMLRK